MRNTPANLICRKTLDTAVLVYVGKGVVIAGDTRRLYKIDMNKAFQDGDTDNAVLGVVKLGGALKGLVRRL